MYSTTGSTAFEARWFSCMSEYRQQHSRATAETCINLARQYNDSLNLELCWKAGLFHDIAREWETERLIRYSQEHELSLEEEEKENPLLLHAPVAAHLLAVGGFDEAVCRAVRYHTLGSIQMGQLGLVLFLADYLEPGRSHVNDEERRALREEKSLEDVCKHILYHQEFYLKSIGKHQASCTRVLRDYIEQGKRL